MAAASQTLTLSWESISGCAPIFLKRWCCSYSAIVEDFDHSWPKWCWNSTLCSIERAWWAGGRIAPRLSCDGRSCGCVLTKSGGRSHWFAHELFSAFSRDYPSCGCVRSAVRRATTGNWYTSARSDSYSLCDCGSLSFEHLWCSWSMESRSCFIQESSGLVSSTC